MNSYNQSLINELSDTYLIPDISKIILGYNSRTIHGDCVNSVELIVQFHFEVF